MVANISEQKKMDIIEQFITTPAGRAKLASSMTLPLRTQRDYKAVGRKAFLVQQLTVGALPIYDRDPDVTAYVVGEEGEGIISVAKSKRIHFPIFEIASVPEVPITEIKQRRFDLVLRMQDKAKSEIQLAEDVRAFATMDAAAAAAGNPNAPIATTAPVSANLLSDSYSNIERFRVRVARSFWNPTDFADIRKFGRDTFDPETLQILLKTGLMGTLYGAQIIVTPQATAGRIYICGEKEFFGRVPVRTELTVISADRPWDRVIGFSCFENLGFGIHNNFAQQTINVAR
jgi:hypothetical protein